MGCGVWVWRDVWRPLASEFVLLKRPVWIVEGTPKDRYYLYGKPLLRFDKESWRGTYNSKYDWQGQILNYVDRLARQGK
jgi:hypothetical protein